VRVILDLISHKGTDCISIGFDYDFDLKEYLKQFPGVRWSKSKRTFYIPFSEEGKKGLHDHLIAGDYRVVYAEDVARMDKRMVQSQTSLMALDSEKIKIHTLFVAYLKGKRYGESTVASYSGFILNFLRFIKKDINLVDEDDVRLFTEWAVATFDYSISTHRQLVSAFKQFAYFYPACAINIDAINRPKRDQKLPTVLNKEEVIALIQATKNLKHRTIIALLYGSGLRVGEILALTLNCFDFERKMLHVKRAKGRKDRYATIPESLLPILKNYYATYKPKHFFIENPKGGAYTAGSIRNFIKQNCKLAGITKRVTPHTLRHSYATHLLEAGTGIRHIQELLGHSKPETTMIYTHIAEKDIQVIKSPLDMMVQELRGSKKEHNNLLIPGPDFRI